MSVKSKCKNVEHYSGNGKVFLSNADEVVFHATSDFDVLNYESRSKEELFLEDEFIVHSAPAHYEEMREVYKKHFGNIELLPPRSRLKTK